jgi:hypothetical protein
MNKHWLLLLMINEQTLAAVAHKIKNLNSKEKSISELG